MSCRIWVRRLGRECGVEATKRAGFRSTMRGVRAGVGRGGSAAVGVSRRQVAAQSIRRAIGAGAPRHRDLRAHPPTDLAALLFVALRDAVRGSRVGAAPPGYVRALAEHERAGECRGCLQ